MKICVYDLDAIGGLPAAKVSTAGHELMCCETWSAVRELIFKDNDGQRIVSMSCPDNPGASGPRKRLRQTRLLPQDVTYD